jgi:hypothetical protein
VPASADGPRLWDDQPNAEKPHPVRLLRAQTSQNPRSEEAVRAFAPNPGSNLWTGCTRLETHAVAGASFSLTPDSEGVQTDALVLLTTPRPISTATRPSGLQARAAMRLTKGTDWRTGAVTQPAAALPENAQRAFSPLETKRQEPHSVRLLRAQDLAESETRISGKTRGLAPQNPRPGFRHSHDGTPLDHDDVTREPSLMPPHCPTHF